ncbi:hypothetical protein MLD38_012555 [Melastoma candidum]|uniref:Uncharacterized protein n=1 Tax=Melastoma candidum TaxID=119954 RepID=A0ACB9R6Q8_9MYRT|nr:hypothetical protein MLD38_012555 [Melastoma candidum]
MPAAVPRPTAPRSTRRSDSFHSAHSTPPPPSLSPPPPPLLLLPLPPTKPDPPSADGLEEAAFRRSHAKDRLRVASYGFRVSQAVLSLVSLSVMASDRTRGWSGDSFYRYREYRFCLSVNAIGLLFSGFQLYDVGYHVISGKHVIPGRLRSLFEFFMDQVMAYLLMSASSAAATRVDDWVLNWGKDQFTKMASTSIGAAFVAFLSFALSSLISGYNLCTRDMA